MLEYLKELKEQKIILYSTIKGIKMTIHNEAKKTITYREKDGKFIFCKRSVYWTLTPSELGEMKEVIADIESGGRDFYKEDARGE